MPISEVHNTDCMAYMATMPDKFFDLAVVDPPYGIKEITGRETSHSRSKLKNRCFNQMSNEFLKWDIPPDPDYFTELFRVSKNQIIWGGNYFDLPPTRGIICWDKMQPWENFSQIEIAWTSFDTPAAIFRFDNRTGDKIHPTQKPVELYGWLLRKYAKAGDIIFDSHLGSGSSRIAAYKMGFDFYGCEINKHYFINSEDRFKHLCLNTIDIQGKYKLKQEVLF